MTATYPSPHLPITPCSHDHAIKGLDSCYCPDCKRSFAAGTAGYKEIVERCNHKWIVTWLEDGKLGNFCVICAEESLLTDRHVLEQWRQEASVALAQYEQILKNCKSEGRRKDFARAIATKKRQIAWIESVVDSLAYEPSSLTSEAGQSSRNTSTSNEFLEDNEPPLKEAGQSSRNTSTSNEFLEDNEPPLKEAGQSEQKTHRNKGDGSGCIYKRKVTKKGKEYYEFHYQYEFWEKGDRLIKSSKYIPKRLVDKIQELDSKKVPVREILDLLGVQK